MVSAALDPHSFANLGQIHCTHSHLGLTADFASKTLSGFVEHSFVCSEDTSEIVLDTSFLDIKSVSSAGTTLAVRFILTINWKMCLMIS